MRKFFGKQGWNRVLSVVLVMALVAGVVGVYPIMAEANADVETEDVITTQDLSTINAKYGLSTEDTAKGVKVTYADGTASQAPFARVGIAKNYLLDEYGVHLEVSDIAYTTSDEYSFVMYLGNESNALYDKSGYMIVYEKSGVVSIVASGKGSGLTKTPIVAGTENVEPLDGVLSVDIRLIDEKYIIAVNDYEYTIDAQYTGDVVTPISDITKAFFSFAILDDGVSDGTWQAGATFEGATYTIESVAYNVGGVTLDSSSVNMVVNQTTSLTANVFPENVTNKNVTWESNNESIVKVDRNGNVTAVAEGCATITVTSNADTTKSATCEVKVTKSGLTIDDFTGVSLSVATFANTSDSTGVQIVYPIGANGSERIRTTNTYPMQNGVSIQIDDIKGETGLYSVVLAIGNDTQQWYDKTGYMLVYGQSGNFTIMQTSCTPNTATAIASGTMAELDGSITIDIKKQGLDYVIEINGTEYTIPNATSVLGESGEHYLSFGVMSDFTLTDGVATNLKYWQYGYYEQAWGSIGRTQDVSYIVRSIMVSPSNATIDKEYMNLLAGENATLTAKVEPLTASQSVNWSSADESIATVNADGAVTAVKAGTTIVTATSKTDASITASCVVRVTEPTSYITADDLSNDSWNTGGNVEQGGVLVKYAANTGAYQRVETCYGDNTKYGYWPSGNGVHIGLKDIQITEDTDTVAIFIGNRVVGSSNYNSLWIDTNAGGYMLFYSKSGSFSIAKVKWEATNRIDSVIVSEQREKLGDGLSLDVRYEDGQYELSVNGKTYAIPGQSVDGCPLMDSEENRIYFAIGLVTGFSVTNEGAISGPTWNNNLTADSSFVITDISHVSTEELTLPAYIQSTLPRKWNGKFVLGKGNVAATTELLTADFNGTLDDSCEEMVWEVTSANTGYYIKKANGDENSFLNISAEGVSLGEAQELIIERVSDNTTAYTTISDGTNYLCMSEEEMTVSTTPDKLILYSVTPELAEATREEPLFTLSTFSDLHSEWIYDSGEKYIRNGIVDATKKVREEDNANVIAFLGDLISDKNGVAGDEVLQHGYWYGQGTENVESEWQKARDLMYAAAESATESGRALYLAGNHEYAIGGTRANPTFNSGDFTDGIESKLPELTEKNAYFQKEADFPEGTSQDIIDAGHVLSYHYNIDGMDIIAINPSYTGAEITKDWSYDLGALEWMEDKLAQIGSDKTVLVLGHYPTSSLDDYEAGMPSYNKIKQIFADYPNVIYLYGHDHNPYIHTDTYQRVQTFAADGVTPFQNRYETPTGYTEAFGGSVAFANDVGLASSDLAGTPAVVQGLLVKVYSDRIVLQMKNYNESPLGVDALREYTIMRDVELNVTENPQEAETVEYTTAFANFRVSGEKKAPVAPQGYVFAGWYYDEACTKPVANETVNVAEDEQIFAKFLPQDVLSVKAQLKLAEGTTTDSVEGKTEMRLITTIDGKLDYQNVGFLINGNPYTCQYAYTSLTAAGFAKTPDVFNSCSKRFVTRNIINLSWNTTTKLVDRPIKVQAFWTTCDGTVIYGQERVITIKQGLDAIAGSEAVDYSLR